MTLKIAFAGLGDHSRRSHVQHLCKMGGVKLVAGFDPDPGAFATVEKEYGVKLQPFTEGYEAMLDTVRPDGVLISSPDRFHFPQLKAAIERGVHVFCEKPLCASESDIEALKACLDQAKDKGLVVTSCHPRRYDVPYVWVKEQLPGLVAQFGAVMDVALDFSYHAPSDHKRDLHGDSLLQDHANHEIDYLNFLLGYDSFQAFKLRDAFDTYALAGKREDGVAFHFAGSRRLPQSVYPETIRVRFERGELFVDTYNQDNSYTLNHGTRVKTPVKPGVTDYETRFFGVNRNWIDAMQGKTQNYLSPADLIVNSALSVGLHGRDSWKSPQGLKRG